MLRILYTILTMKPDTCNQCLFTLCVALVLCFLALCSVRFHSDNTLVTPRLKSGSGPIIPRHFGIGNTFDANVREDDMTDNIGNSVPSKWAYSGRKFVWPWFSLRSFMRVKIPPTVKFICGGDVILFQNAYLNVSKIKGAPVVIFAGGFNETDIWRELKASRDPNQLWVMNTDESALTAMEYLPPQEYIDQLKFNITFTYHTKSQISVAYGYYTEYPGNDTRRLSKMMNIHKQKPRFAAWTSSHCDTIGWSRTEFAEDLAKHIPLDRYGKCGNLSCEQGTPKCRRLMKQYKFIFALENSCCEEYITEKFWHSLVVLQSIPVVLGAKKEDYQRVAPPNSFIHAGDFSSMEELAEYLKKVAVDPVLYNSYFQWKSNGSVRETGSQRRIRFKYSVCTLHKYIKSNAWANISEPFDVYGKHWLGSCRGCSDKGWIREYGEAPARFIHN